MITVLTDKTRLEQEMSVEKGRTHEEEVTVYDADNAAKDITGCQAWLDVVDNRATLSEGTANPAYLTTLFTRKNTAAGGGDTEIEMTDPGNGKLVVKIAVANTSGLDVSANESDYKFYVTIYKSADWGTRTVAGGNFVLDFVPGVTPQ